MSDNATQTVNKIRLDIFKALSGAVFHAAADTPISAPDATDLGSLVTLTNSMIAAFAAHVTNVVDPTSGVGIHGADSADRVTGTAADLGSAGSLIVQINRAFRSHACNRSAHLSADRLPAFTAQMTDITLLPAMCTYANVLKAAINTHFASAMNSQVAA